MREVVFPEIPYEEYKHRNQEAKRLMEEHDIDALLLFCIENIYYYTGFRKTWMFHWIHACIFPKDGDSILVVPQISHRIAERTSWVKEVRAFGGAEHWKLPQDPRKIIPETLEELGVAKKRIGIELNGPAMYTSIFPSELEAIKNALPDAKFVNATDMIWKQRMIKTSWEIETFKKLCDITVKGFKAGLESIREGITESEVLKVIWKTFISEGACDTPMAGQVMFRGGVKDYDMSTARPVDCKLTRGRQIFFDGGPCYKGYYTDIQREACIGDPPELQKKLYELSIEGQEVAEDALKPGNKISEVHRAAMSVIGEVPDDLKTEGVKCLYSHLFMGHGIGLAIHEPPWITAEDNTPLRPGMILTLEVPALDIPKFRVLGGFPEDIYLITKDGYENLTEKLSRELWIVK